MYIYIYVYTIYIYIYIYTPNVYPRGPVKVLLKSTSFKQAIGAYNIASHASEVKRLMAYNS